MGEARLGSRELSNEEACLVPQENSLPIVLKPSHKTRILNVNIVHLCVYVYVCAI